MPLILQRLGCLPVVLLAAFFCLSPGQAAGLATVYRSEIRPLLDQFCFECHADEDAEADRLKAAQSPPSESGQGQPTRPRGRKRGGPRG